VKTVYTLS